MWVEQGAADRAEDFEESGGSVWKVWPWWRVTSQISRKEEPIRTNTKDQSNAEKTGRRSEVPFWFCSCRGRGNRCAIGAIGFGHKGSGHSAQHQFHGRKIGGGAAAFPGVEGIRSSTSGDFTMSDLKARLLQHPQSSSHHHQQFQAQNQNQQSAAAAATAAAAAAIFHLNLQGNLPGGGGRGAPSAIPKPLFQGIDVAGGVKKKRGQSVRSWIRIDRGGGSQVLEMDKMSIMRRCDLPARDLRLLDPLFVYPSTLLGRERAIVVNLEQIRCIITADEVLLLNSLDHYVLQYVSELQRRLVPSSNRNSRRLSSSRGSFNTSTNSGYDSDPHNNSSKIESKTLMSGSDADMFSGSSNADDLPFEFRALEVALESACTYLDTQATELEEEAYPVLDDLTSKISTLNLERVRRLKSRLVALTRRVQKVRDEIEHLMDDDGDMAEMYLTEKKERADGYFFGHTTASMSAPVSPVGSPRSSNNNVNNANGRSLDKSLSLGRNRHDVLSGSESETERVEELEMLLEAYFVVIDGTLNKLTSLKEYIDDTEDFINIQLDNVRNQLIQFELLLTTATFVVAIFGVVAGVFGMNIQIDLFEEPRAFKWILITSGVSGIAIFFAFILFFKQRRLLSL